MSGVESVEGQLATAWYDECLRLMRELAIVKEEKNTLRKALLIAQGYMPTGDLNEAIATDVKEVFDALGWVSYPKEVREML